LAALKPHGRNYRRLVDTKFTGRISNADRALRSLERQGIVEKREIWKGHPLRVSLLRMEADEMTTPVRVRPPNRRPNKRPKKTLGMGRYDIAFGFYPDSGKICEVFADSPHRGTEFSHIITDVSTVISIALQYGVPVGELAGAVGRVPAFLLGREVEVAASPVGEIRYGRGRT
jgi:hypothetical protein